jgi:hypothetical protein
VAIRINQPEQEFAMTNEAKRHGTVTVWAIAVALSLVGVVLAVALYAQSRDSKILATPTGSRCVQEVELTSTTSTTSAPTTVSADGLSTTTTIPSANTTLPQTTTTLPPEIYIDKDGNTHVGPPATLPPTTWRVLGLDTCKAVTIADLKFGDEICVVSLRDNGRFEDYRFVEAVELRPTIKGQGLPSYADGSGHFVVVDWGDSEELFYYTYDSAQLGLDGSHSDRRTFAGTCEVIKN